MSIYRDALKQKMVPAAERKQPRIHPERYPHPQDLMQLVDFILNAGLRTVSLSGVQPGDGVSFVAAELAYVLSKNTVRELAGGSTSDRVLLVEVGLEEGTGSKGASGTAEDSGLANNMLFTKNHMPGVDYIYTAPTNQGTLEFVNTLWSYNAKSNFFDKWHTVIFDCPPVLQKRETLALTRKTDAALLVVSQGGAKKEVIQAACTFLKHGKNFSGAILNRRKLRIPQWLYRMI